MLVIDASVTLAWLLPEENAAAAEAVLRRLANEPACVPAIWWYEVRNVLVVCERRGRMAAEEVDRTLSDLQHLPIRVTDLRDAGDVLPLARQHALSVYDAAYLALARHAGATLCTFDHRLREAAISAGVIVWD